MLAQNSGSQDQKVSEPTKKDDEQVILRWKKDGKNDSASLWTGVRHDNSDDLPKKMDPKEKAKKIKELINNSSAPVNADIKKDGVTVTVTPDTGVELKEFKIKNFTKERVNRAAGLAPVGSGLVVFGVADFQGPVLGFDDDGNPAEVMLGTDVVQVTIETASFGDVESMSAFLASALQLLGVPACLTGPATIAIPLADGEGMHYGCSDLGILQGGAVVFVNMDEGDEEDKEEEEGEPQ